MNVEDFLPDDLDVQKAVVESLAADKAEQDEKIETLRNERNALKSEITELKKQIEELKAAVANYGEALAKNSETELSNKATLLERNPEINDRFEGETRDHVIEVIKEARDAAEKDGRIRRAQVLESVLIVNEPIGNLEKNREELVKLFNDNSNIISGVVIEELERKGISHKNGEEYLLATEILKRTY